MTWYELENIPVDLGWGTDRCVRIQKIYCDQSRIQPLTFAGTTILFDTGKTPSIPLSVHPFLTIDHRYKTKTPRRRL
jgi:hypothetical protein